MSNFDDLFTKEMQNPEFRKEVEREIDIIRMHMKRRDSLSEHYKIVSVEPMENVTLLVTFYNGIKKIYDVKILYSIFPQFKAFKTDTELFNQVQVDAGGYGISWNDDLDLDSNDIWLDGKEVTK